MKYTAVLNDQERELEVTRLDEYRFRVSVDGDVLNVDARVCAEDMLSLLVNNVSHDITYDIEDTMVHLNFRNRHYSIDILDERRMRMRKVRSELDLSGPEVISTSMPGKVVKVQVELGQQVKADTAIIIVEAMKMENEIRCRNEGVVKAIHVTAGQTVEGGAPLVEIEPLEE